MIGHYLPFGKLLANIAAAVEEAYQKKPPKSGHTHRAHAELGVWCPAGRRRWKRAPKRVRLATDSADVTCASCRASFERSP